MKLYGFLVRSSKKLMHYYGFHYAPVKGPMNDGKYFRWCYWCGFRETYSKDPDNKSPLTPFGMKILVEKWAKDPMLVTEKEAVLLKNVTIEK